MDSSDKKIVLAKIITALVCIGVLAGAFKLTFDSLDIKEVKLEEKVETTNLAQKSMTASILAIDFDKELVKLYDFNKRLAYEEQYNLSSACRFLDKDAKLLSKDNFEVGSIVEITYTENTNIISKMQLSKKSWCIDKVTNYNFDYNNKSMEVNGQKFTLGDELAISYQGNKASYKELENENLLLAVRGYDDIVLGIEIKNILGRIRLTYMPELDNSTVQIGNDKIVKIEDVLNTYLVPGEYELVIIKKGIDEIVLKTVVEENQITDVIVNDVNIKKTILTLKTNKEGYMVSIKALDSSYNRTFTDDPLSYDAVEPFSTSQISVPYGSYAFTFIKNGYKSVTKKVELNEETKTISVSFTTEEDKLQEEDTTIEKVKLTLDTKPENAKIYINGEYKGIGKITVRVPKGDVNIKVMCDGYQTIERNYQVEENKEYSFILSNDNMYESPTGEIVDDINGGI